MESGVYTDPHILITLGTHQTFTLTATLLEPACVVMGDTSRIHPRCGINEISEGAYNGRRPLQRELTCALLRQVPIHRNHLGIFAGGD